MILFQNLHLPIDTKPIYPLTSPSNNNFTNHYSITLTYPQLISKPNQSNDNNHSISIFHISIFIFTLFPTVSRYHQIQNQSNQNPCTISNSTIPQLPHRQVSQSQTSFLSSAAYLKKFIHILSTHKITSSEL